MEVYGACKVFLLTACPSVDIFVQLHWADVCDVLWTRDQLTKRQPALRRQLSEASSVEAVLQHLLEENQWPQTMPVVAGSLYLLGDLFTRNVVEAE